MALNPRYFLDRMEEVLDEQKQSFSKDQAKAHLAELGFWLSRCEPTDEARNRDQTAPDPRRQVR